MELRTYTLTILSSLVVLSIPYGTIAESESSYILLLGLGFDKDSNYALLSIIISDHYTHASYTSETLTFIATDIRIQDNTLLLANDDDAYMLEFMKSMIFDDTYYIVMYDSEGNEFALFTAVNYGDKDLYFVGNESSTTVEYTKDENILYVYVEPLPDELEHIYNGVIDEALDYWKRHENKYFIISNDETKHDIYISWAKELFDETGYAYGDFVEVSLGDSNCIEKWKPYDYETVLGTLMHEIGHTLGYEHSNNPNNVMYHTADVKYYYDLNEEDIMLPSYVTFYPFCSDIGTTKFTIEVESSIPLDVYVVPSEDDYHSFVNDEEFYYYESCSSEEAMYIKTTCVVDEGSGIILYNPSIDEVADYSIFIAAQ